MKNENKRIPMIRDNSVGFLIFLICNSSHRISLDDYDNDQKELLSEELFNLELNIAGTDLYLIKSGYYYTLDKLFSLKGELEIKGFKKKIKNVEGMIERIKGGELIRVKEGSNKEEYGCLTYYIEDKNVKTLKSRLNDYIDEYNEKNLIGQESVKRPIVYNDLVLSEINDEDFIYNFGLKRVVVSYLSTTESRPFNHSLLSLDRMKKIDLLNLSFFIDQEQTYIGSWEYVFSWKTIINNKSINEKIQKSIVGCWNKSGLVYSYGTNFISFSSKEDINYRLFCFLLENIGSPLTIENISKCMKVDIQKLRNARNDLERS